MLHWKPLLEYLPETGVLFPKKQYIYLRQVGKYIDKKFTWNDLRKANMKKKYESMLKENGLEKLVKSPLA